MRQSISKALFPLAAAGLILSFILMLLRIEPFYTYFYLLSWWFYLLALDSWLYLKGGESLLLENPGKFVTFLVPLSALIWFVFETLNLRLENWHYTGLTKNILIRWPGYFFAFGTVVPGIFLTANTLEKMNVYPKNEFSLFFAETITPRIFYASSLTGIVMLTLPLLWPAYFYPLIWGGFVFLLDPWVAKWQGKSLIQEWRQMNFNRTFQILLAGLICGVFWEFWNFWAGAKWVYTVPLPEILLKNLKIFEMPALGFLGFPAFALECFVITEFAACLRERLSPVVWKAGWALSLLYMAWACRSIDLHSVLSYG